VFAIVGSRRMRTVLVNAIRCGSGVTAIEYALIGGLISIAIVTGATQVGVNISGFFTAVANAFP
jgi:pilus assembly protein Flp/PilA